MTRLATLVERLEINRRQTLRFLDYLQLLARSEARERAARPDDEAARLLAADPAPGALGAIGWHLMHIAVYEESCVAQPEPELWERHRHGVAPGGPVAPLAEIVERLAAGRAILLERVGEWTDGGLAAPPEETAQPGMTRRQLLDAAVWHEPHHLNLCNENLRRQFIEEGCAAS